MSPQKQAQTFAEITNELEQALKHSQICESHFQAGEVPRGCAHAFALEGHLENVMALLKQVKVLHATMAQV